eukprot:scaffold120062_cov69-Phaeocystis_antarctica.AAC.1
MPATPSQPPPPPAKRQRRRRPPRQQLRPRQTRSVKTGSSSKRSIPPPRDTCSLPVKLGKDFSCGTSSSCSHSREFFLRRGFGCLSCETLSRLVARSPAPTAAAAAAATAAVATAAVVAAVAAAAAVIAKLPEANASAAACGARGGNGRDGSGRSGGRTSPTSTASSTSTRTARARPRRRSSSESTLLGDAGIGTKVLLGDAGKEASSAEEEPSSGPAPSSGMPSAFVRSSCPCHVDASSACVAISRFSSSPMLGWRDRKSSRRLSPESVLAAVCTGGSSPSESCSTRALSISASCLGLTALSSSVLAWSCAGGSGVVPSESRSRNSLDLRRTRA